MGDRQNLRVGRDVAHIRVVSHGPFATLLGCRHHGGGRRVKSQHVGALVEQRHGRVALARRVKPGVEPDQLDRRLRVDRAHPQRERVDALHHLRDRETRDISRHMGFAHARGGNPRQITALVIAGIGGRDVGCGFVAGDGFKTHMRKVPRHRQCGLHVAKAGCENQRVALARQIADHALGVRPLGHAFHKTGLHLVAQRFLQSQAT